MFLRNCWYVAMWSEALTGVSLHSRQIMGEPIIFFRTEDGTAVAMLDSCPHRFAAFSVLGRLLPEDRIQCPYHGLVFNTRGQCVHNPHGTGNLPASASVKTFPCHEQDTLVWVWMGDPARAETGSIPRFRTLVESPPELVSKRDYIEFDASYLLIVENLLDLSHSNILHEGILGNEESFVADIKVETGPASLTVTRLNSNVPVPGMYDLMYRQDGGRVDMWSKVTWHAAGNLVNDTGVTEVGGAWEAGSSIHGHHFLTPISEIKTLYHFCGVRQNPLTLDPKTEQHVRDQISVLRRTAFEHQDKAVISAQQLNLSNPAIDTSRPALFKIDDAPVRFRRILDKLVADEQPAVTQ